MLGSMCSTGLRDFFGIFRRGLLFSFEYSSGSCSLEDFFAGVPCALLAFWIFKAYFGGVYYFLSNILTVLVACRIFLLVSPPFSKAFCEVLYYTGGRAHGTLPKNTLTGTQWCFLRMFANVCFGCESTWTIGVTR